MSPDNDHNKNPFEAPGAQQMAAWTLRLAHTSGLGWLLSADPHLFALLYASCAAAVPPPPALAGDGAEDTTAGERLLPALKDLQRQFGEHTSGRFARLYLQGNGVFSLVETDGDAYRRAIGKWRKTAEIEAARFVTSLDQNLDRLAELLGLNPLERDLLAFQIGRQLPGFSQLFELLTSSDQATAVVLGSVLDVPSTDIVSALSEGGALVRSGLLSVRERPLTVSGPSIHLRAVLFESADDDAGFIERFVRPLAPSPSTGSLGRLQDDDQRILLGLLRQPMPADHGVQVLVHGPQSVDKRDMLARLFRDEGVEGYAVATRHVPSGEMPTWTYIAQRHLEKSQPDAVLVVDRAHEALACRPMSILSLFRFDDDDDDLPADDDDERASDKGLTGAHVRCVWMTDRARQLSERNLGAFLFQCEAFAGSRAERRQRVAQVISDFGLSTQLEHELAKYSLLGEQQVRQAAELARLLVPSSGKNDATAMAERERVIKRAVAQSQKTLGRDKTEGLRDSVTQYSLDLLNLGGRFTPQQIIAALRKNSKGSLCLWGIPGAGKTQLAEYIAVELDLPILMRSASELLSKWVGESEKQIASMFTEAEAEGALLFLDEADSFLRDRALARAEWSITQVNELLQRMERFDGIFIAATNMMDSLDPAAMRRFTWKIEFRALAPEQAWTMFCNETGLDAAGEPERSEELKGQLAEISDLAPGDFATVKRQSEMLDEELTPEAWIDQLATEAKAKMAGLRRQKLGFGAR
jgi:ATPase family protein associated with various cellular activities (AAA)